MELLNLFHRRDENTRCAWGHVFQWTPEHLTPDQYEPLKYSYDTLADECLEILNSIDVDKPSDTPSTTSTASAPSPAQRKDVPLGDLQSSAAHTDDKSETEEQAKTRKQNSSALRPKRDLYLLLRDHHSTHPKLQQLWDEVTTIPSWVDWDEVARGQEVFYRYGGATLTGLAYQSLLGGMGSNRVVEVLARTGGFSVEKSRHRLYETTQYILECTKSLEAIQAPNGAGFASSIRVRLLHAAVRQRILKLTKTRPSYYSVEQNGIPINDLDCIGTIATFSSTILFLSLPRQGIFPTQSEITSYLALWRLIAHYTGTPTDTFATASQAKAMMESLLLGEINPSPTSRILAANVIRSLENQPPAYASRSFLESNARWLNGNKLCDELDIGRPSLYYWALTAGQCLFFMALCYTYRSVASWDRRKVAALRKIFWNVIVENKEIGGLGEETVFEFKYVPDFGVGTVRGGDEEKKLGATGVERRNLRTLLVAGGVMAAGSYVGLKIGWWMFGRLF